MTLKSDMQDDLDNIGLDTDEFAQTVTYIQGDTQTSISAIIDWQETIPVLGDEGVKVAPQAVIHFSKTDIALPATTDQVSLTPPWASTAETWDVIGRPVYDGGGMWSARITRTAYDEQTAKAYRRPL